MSTSACKASRTSKASRGPETGMVADTTSHQHCKSASQESFLLLSLHHT
jgi:hypothetical protein